MYKVIFYLFSALNSNLRGKNKVNNSRDFFQFLKIFRIKNFRKEYFGISFHVDPINSSVSSRLLLTNDFENDDIRNFVSIIPDSGTLLDIGANIGLYSCIVAKNKPDYHIFSFEPANHVFQFLLKNTEAFPNIIPVNLGIGSQNAINTFYEYQDDALSSFIPSDRSKLIRTVNAMSIVGDQFIDQYSITNISAIKIDVEGFELEVLKGLKKLLTEQNPIIQIELIYQNESAQECHNYLSTLGYSCFYWESGKLISTASLINSEYNYIYKK